MRPYANSGAQRNGNLRALQKTDVRSQDRCPRL
jgi:hypothetical protein